MKAPLAQIALHHARGGNVVDMPPSSYRPSPPSTRQRPLPPNALDPDRQLVDGYAAPKHEPTLRSTPTPPGEVAEVAGKRRRPRSPETIAKFKATMAAKRAAEKADQSVAPKLDGLDLILDIIELCERAKKGLTKSQRMRLRAALHERLS
jgi:hypothetical protein